MTESLAPFGEDAPHTPGMSGSGQSPAMVETPTTSCSALNGRPNFRPYIEAIICEKINAHYWPATPGWHYPRVTPHRMRSRAQHKAITRARHWSWYFLRHHPHGGKLSCPKLGKLYGRDHTTVLYGLVRTANIIEDYPRSIEVRCLHEIAEEIRPHFGEYEIGRGQ